MIQRQPLLWSWVLLGVPTGFGLVFYYAFIAKSAVPPHAAAVNALPGLFVASGLVAAHYAIHAEAGRIRRIVFYVLYGFAMYWLCLVVALVIAFAHAGL
jgi:hypothetical protein